MGPTNCVGLHWGVLPQQQTGLGPCHGPAAAFGPGRCTASHTQSEGVAGAMRAHQFCIMLPRTVVGPSLSATRVCMCKPSGAEASRVAIIEPHQAAAVKAQTMLGQHGRCATAVAFLTCECMRRPPFLHLHYMARLLRHGRRWLPGLPPTCASNDGTSAPNHAHA